MEFVTAAQLQQWSLLAAHELTDQELVGGVAEVVHVENVLGAVKLRMLAQIELLFATEWPFQLTWTGSVSRQIAHMLAGEGRAGRRRRAPITCAGRDPVTSRLPRRRASARPGAARADAAVPSRWFTAQKNAA